MRTGVVTELPPTVERAEASDGRAAWPLALLAAATLAALTLGGRTLYRWSAPLRTQPRRPKARRAAHA
jgi:hypothetical protein